MPIILRWFLRLGPLNPITVRLVQGGSRRKRHLYMRSIYLGALIVALLYWLVFLTPSALSVRGLAIAASGAFSFVAKLQIALICLLAPVFMAGAIAQEANPKTWDILLTTPLSASEIVLGNLIGRLFFIIALLFSSLPLFAVTQYFGGVPGQSILASYLIAAAAALLVGSTAIALSVSRLVGKRAVFTFYIAVVSYLAITYVTDRAIAIPGRVSMVTALNPFLALQALLDPTGYARYPEGSVRGLSRWFLEKPVTTWCTLCAVVSLLLMAASTITVRSGGIAGAGGIGGRAGGGVPWYRKVFGLGASGAQTRPARTVWTNPIAWREAAARNATFGKMLARWSFIGIGALWGLGIVLYYHGGGIATPIFRNVLLGTVMGELLVITLIAIVMSASAVAREREDGTLDLLLTTPITPAQYLGGKVRGMVAYLIPLLSVPVGTLFLAGLYVGLVQAGMMSRTDGVTISMPRANMSTPLPVAAVLPEAGILAAIVSIPFAALCCMVGLHFSLKSKGSIGSVVWTVVVVGAVAGVLGFCGHAAGSQFPLVGPVLTGLSPGALIYSTIMPEDGIEKTIVDNGLGTARVALLLGTVIGAGVFMAVVYGLRASLVHNFDMTVRKLAGTA